MVVLIIKLLPTLDQGIFYITVKIYKEFKWQRSNTKPAMVFNTNTLQPNLSS